MQYHIGLGAKYLRIHIYNMYNIHTFLYIHAYQVVHMYSTYVDTFTCSLHMRVQTQMHIHEFQLSFSLLVTLGTVLCRRVASYVCTARVFVDFSPAVADASVVDVAALAVAVIHVVIVVVCCCYLQAATSDLPW